MITDKLFFKFFLILFLFLSHTVGFAQEGKEQVELSNLIRHINFLQKLVEQKAKEPIYHHSRYYFDYQRLNRDLKKIQLGINDYLIPARAQPRDLSVLAGDYQQENKK